MPEAKNKSKLKRNRKLRLVNNSELFSVSGGSRIIFHHPTASDPTLRKFIPERKTATELDLAKLGVIDWRVTPHSAAVWNIRRVVNKIICADSATVLKLLPDNSVDCIITSPPYWNVIDYGLDGQLGFCSY